MSKLSEIFRLHILLPLAEAVKGTCAHVWYGRIAEMNTWTHEQIVAWQTEHLRAFIKHAYEHTKYYRELFDSLAITPEDIQTADDLKKLPVLTKDIVHARFDDFVPDNIQTMRYREDKTGGTTGEPMRYLTDENVWGYITASKIYSWRFNGYHYGDKFAALGSSSLFKKKSPLVRRVYDWIRQEKGMNSLNMSDELCALYLERMRKEHIHFVYGYASSVYLLAKYARDHGVDTSFIKGAFTTSENLTNLYRETIEHAFGCRVMDCYGARDAGITAFEIERGKYYISYDVIPEIVNTFGENEGELITTGFLNYTFPLIRYNYGDCAQLKLTDNQYNGAVLTKIYGRSSDVLRLDNGHVLTSPGFTILMNKFDVHAYDVQKVSGIEVKMQIQTADGWTKAQEKKLSDEMQRYVGEGCKFSIEYVDGFQELQNGKRRYFMIDVSKK